MPHCRMTPERLESVIECLRRREGTPAKDFLPELAQYLGVSVRTLRRYRREKSLPTAHASLLEWVYADPRYTIRDLNRNFIFNRELLAHPFIEKDLLRAVTGFEVGYFSWDPQTEQNNIDVGMRAMLAIPEHVKVTSKLWRQNVHPDDMPRLSAGVASGRGYDVKYRFRGVGDGVERIIHTRSVARPRDGKPPLLCGVLVNLTNSNTQRAIDAIDRAVEVAGLQDEQAMVDLLSALRLHWRRIMERELHVPPVIDMLAAYRAQKPKPPVAAALCLAAALTSAATLLNGLTPGLGA